MKNRIFLLAALFLTVGVNAGRAQSTPESADVILKRVYAQASKEHKNVMILFHASWCGWCKKMEASLNDPTIKKSFDDNYVITWFTVEESKPEMKKTENPGAMDLKTKYHGEIAGLPFFLIMDANGKLLADSYMPPAKDAKDARPENLGCPASSKEVAYFSDMLKATSKIQEPQLALIRERFSKNDVAPAVAPVKATSSK